MELKNANNEYPAMLATARKLLEMFKHQLTSDTTGMTGLMDEPESVIEKIRWNLGSWAVAAAGVRLTSQAIDLLERREACASGQDARASLLAHMLSMVCNGHTATEKPAADAVVISAYARAATIIIDGLFGITRGLLSSEQTAGDIIDAIDTRAASRKAEREALLHELIVYRHPPNGRMRGYYFEAKSVDGRCVIGYMGATNKREAMKEAADWLSARHISHHDLAHQLSTGGASYGGEKKEELTATQ